MGVVIVRQVARKMQGVGVVTARQVARKREGVGVVSVKFSSFILQLPSTPSSQCLVEEGR